MSTPSLISSHYTSLLAWSRNDGVYICQNPKTRERKAFRIDKGFVPQTLQQVILDGYNLRKSLLQNPHEARTVVDALKYKCVKKEIKTKDEFVLIRLIRLVCDCVRNFFAGRGIKSTMRLANDLIAELETVATPKIKPSAIIPNEPNEKEIKKRLSKLKNQIREAVLSYKNDPINCSQEVKELLFNGMQIQPDPRASVENLIKYVSQKQIDFSNTLCKRVILDLLSIGNNDKRDLQLSEFLMDQRDVLDKDLLNSCIELTKTQNKQGKASALKNFHTLRLEKGWDANNESQTFLDSLRVDSKPPKISSSSQPVEASPSKKPNKVAGIYNPNPNPVIHKPPESLEGLVPHQKSYVQKDMLFNYKKDPTACEKELKAPLFQIIKQMTVEQKLSMVDLIDQLFDVNSSVDLNNLHAATAVVDVFEYCTKYVQFDLVDWLSWNKSFNPKLLIACLDILVKKAPLDVAPLKNLLAHYVNSGWMNDYPPNHETISSAITLLFMRNPNFEEDKVIKAIDSIIEHPSVDSLILLKWIAVFKYKQDEAEKVQGKKLDIKSPILDKIIGPYHQKGSNLFFDFNSAHHKKALAFVLDCYHTNPDFKDMEPQKLIEEILHFAEIKK